jgi:hypothetical protein
MVALPKGVQRVRAGGRTYYYWVSNRNTPYEGQRIALGKDPADPEFWAKLKAAARGEGRNIQAGTFSALIREYRSSADWDRLLINTRDDYSIYFDRIEAAWGDLPVCGLTTIGIYKLRDQYAATPVAANHLVSVLRTLLGWGLPRGYCATNPALAVVSINIIDEQGARPWPEWAYRLILTRAPEHLRRAAILGRSTGQRRSDLVKMGRRNRRDDGLDVTICKLRGKRHFIPLRADELAELDSWSCSDTGPWIVSPTGRAMSGDHLAASLRRFVESMPELAKLEKLTAHGWRAMAVCDRRLQGLEHQEISAQLCMSMDMVIRYSRHIDQEALARRARDKLERRTNRLKKEDATD